MRGKILLVLAAAGLVISGYLVLKTEDPSSVVCSIGGGCETVLSSQWARIGPLSVAWLGVAWYVALLVVIWLTDFSRRATPLVLIGWAASGLLFSLYLLYLEAFKIKAYCTWCLASLVIVGLIFVISFVKIKPDVPRQ
ncbi:MAG: vitamin K epoxide reductase family protein [Patescibacteria group bacterium]